MSFARTDRSFYLIRVITPDGNPHDVSGYGLCHLKQGIRRCRQLRDVLESENPPENRGPLRSAWRALIREGHDPRLCRAELVRYATEASKNAVNGWETVLVLEPRFELV